MTSKLVVDDIAEVVMGQSPKGEDVNTVGDGVPLLNGPTEFMSRYPKPVQFTEMGRKFSEVGDILFCVRGSTTGRMNYSDQSYAIGRGIAAIRGKNGFPTPYIRAVLEKNLDRLLAAATGSTFPNVGRELLLNFEVATVSPEDALPINDLIVSLEDKIELNRQTNQTLEEMVQAVFKSWFVDFEPTRAKIKARENGQDPTRAAMAAIAGKTVEQLDTLSPEQIETLTATADLFPDSLIPSELGEIPEGWEVTDLKSTTSELRRGISPKYCDEDGVPVVNQKCIRNHSVNFSKTRLHDPNQRIVVGRQLEVGDVLVNSTGVGTLGRLAPVRHLEGLTVFDSHVTVVRAETTKISTAFLACLMFEKETFIEASGAGSTGQTELRKQVLEDIQFAIPTKDLAKSFDAIVDPMGHQISVLEQEQGNLASIRDTLLPKLLSGEIVASGHAEAPQ